MTVWIIACSKQAYLLSKELEEKWKRLEPGIRIERMVKCTALPDISETCTLSRLVGEWFKQADALVFVCAVGIAVRSIAPYLTHKSLDPAVVVVDETGKFSISLLSGHGGGANELAERIGGMIGAMPVITTATDREHKFAVDEFARKNSLAVTDWKAAKIISARILSGERIGICSELPVEGEMPKELFWVETPKEPFVAETHREQPYMEMPEKPFSAGGEGEERRPDEPDALSFWESEAAGQPVIRISCRQSGKEALSGSRTLLLVPKCVAVGVGCRKGTPAGAVKEAVSACLREAGIRPEAVFAVASIDLKKQEPGLVEFCESRGIPFFTYPAKALMKLSGHFSGSGFVERVTGVDCVCERSAVMAAGNGLICSKKVYGSVTVALAGREGSVVF